jgi:hypothetical protein
MPREHWASLFLVPALLVGGLITSRAEESCLLAPNTPSPQGSHWYYRTDRNSQKKCWHLRTNGQTSEQSVRQPEQRVISEAAAPLPRPAPEKLRQHSSSVPTSQAPTGTSGGIVNPEAVQNSPGGANGPSNAIVAWPPPPPPATSSDVLRDAPTGTVTATPPSSTSSDNVTARPTGQPLDADEDDVVQRIVREGKPNVGSVQQQPMSDDVQAERDISVARNKALYNAISLAMLVIIAATFIFVGIMLNRTLVRVRRAAMVDTALPAQAKNTETTEGALGELLQIMQYEPNNVRRAGVLTR